LNLHVSLTQANVPHAAKFIEDLQEVVASLLKNGSAIDSDELARIVSENAGKPVEEVMMAVIPLIGLTGLDLPEKMGTLNTVLSLLPADVRDEMLTLFFNMS
jgi:hypothetical protein